MSIQAPPRRTVERVPPRRRAPRRSVWRRTIWPLLKCGALIVLIVLAAQTVIGRVARPLNLLRSEYSETRQIRTELESLKKENAMLERRIKYLQTSRGAAQAARKLGYVKPGEITLVLPADAPPPPDPAPR